ncbi:MAG TPA: VOC family protein [Solirubrobacteraceae bacterium]|jgi:catechol 2,3-dioxygenase-like lactoylglutathione lyase family enzyme|nr:VOC family protein [Solirubrobacteraceae bacterium]
MGQLMHHFGITVDDLDRSVPFYTGYFDLVEIKRVPLSGEGISTAVGIENVEMTCCLLAGENTVLELITYDAPSSRPYKLSNSDVGAVHPCFAVDDIDALYERMSGDGVVFHHEPQELGWGTKMAYCVDPDGINIELLQPAGELLLPNLLAEASSVG